MSKNYLAYTFLTLAALFWSGNFIIGKFATLFEVPPLTLNFFRWVMVWFILIPFTIREIIAKRDYIKENFLVISVMGILTISTFNSVVYCFKLHSSNKCSFNVSCYPSNDNNFFIDYEN